MRKESIPIKVRSAGSKYVTAETTEFVRGVRVGTILELPIWLFPYPPQPNEQFTIAIRERSDSEPQ